MEIRGLRRIASKYALGILAVLMISLPVSIASASELESTMATILAELGFDDSDAKQSRGKSTRPIPVTGDVEAPVKVHAPSPHYTRPARRAQVKGVVIVRAVIDKKGDVTDVELVESLPMGLGDQAVKAIKEWKFEPAVLDGKPVDVYYDLTVNFELAD